MTYGCATTGIPCPDSETRSAPACTTAGVHAESEV